MAKKTILIAICLLVGFATTMVIQRPQRLMAPLRQVPFLRAIVRPYAAPLETNESQMAIYGTKVRARISDHFKLAGCKYPPDHLTMVVIKDTKELMVYGAAKDKKYKYICTYPVLGASGVLGPKLREGDYQVPEGLYELTLEPNTPYHLALRLNYPNQMDRARALADGRDNPGSDILIHGNIGSVGCMAMGDPASEDLFVMAYDTKTKPLRLIIAPVDWRDGKVAPQDDLAPLWLPALYDEIKTELVKLPLRDPKNRRIIYVP